MIRSPKRRASKSLLRAFYEPPKCRQEPPQRPEAIRGRCGGIVPQGEMPSLDKRVISRACPYVVHTESHYEGCGLRKPVILAPMVRQVVYGK